MGPLHKGAMAPPKNGTDPTEEGERKPTDTVGKPRNVPKKDTGCHGPPSRGVNMTPCEGDASRRPMTGCSGLCVRQAWGGDE